METVFESLIWLPGGIFWSDLYSEFFDQDMMKHFLEKLKCDLVEWSLDLEIIICKLLETGARRASSWRRKK